jgi:hypothetical protein
MMRQVLGLCALAATLTLGACAHSISIEPGSLLPTGRPTSNRSVAYVISAADLAREAFDRAPGGDSVNYFPYRDIESGLRQMLQALYAKVVVLRDTGDVAVIQRDDVSLIFMPTLSTQTTRFSPLTWVPTNFSLLISYRVQDVSGREVYHNTAHGDGRAYYTEVIDTRESGLAGRRAAREALAKMREQIESAPELK